MSYMREPYYVFRDGEAVHLHDGESHVIMAQAHFDAIVLMRAAQLLKDPAATEAAKKIVLENRVNRDADAALVEWGLPTASDARKLRRGGRRKRER